MVSRRAGVGRPRLERLVSLILDHSGAALAAVLAVTVAFAIAATGVQVDSSVEGMLPEDDPELAFYGELKEHFGSDEVVIIGLKAPRLFGRPALEAIQRISESLREITLVDDPEPGRASYLVDRVVSLTDVDQVRGARDADGTSTFSVGPFLDRLPETDAQRHALRQRALADPLFVDNFLARPKDGDDAGPLTTLILARIVDRPGDLTYRHRIMSRVEAICRRELGGAAGIERFHLAGTPILKATLTRMGETELAKTVPATFAVLMLLLFAVFRTRSGVLLPVATIAIACVWTVGFLTLCGARLNVGSSIILPLVQVIGAATSIYLLSEYHDGAAELREPRALVKRTLSHVLLPSLLASATTALGFLAVATSPIAVVRDVGLYSAFGVMAVWLVAVTLIPARLLRVEPPAAGGTRGAAGSRAMLAAADRLSDFTERHSRAVLGAGLALMALAALGIARLEPTTDLIGFLRDSHPLPRAYRFLEAEIGGARPLDLSVRAGARELLEPAVLREVAALQDWLATQPEVDHVFSIVDYLRRMHHVMHDEDPAYFRLPETRAQVASYLLLYEDPVESRTAPFLYPEWERAGEARISARTHNLDTGQVANLQARIERWVRERGVEAGPPGASNGGLLANGGVSVRATGSSVLYARMANAVVEGQVTSIALAFAGIWIAVMLLMRSVRGGSVAMIPNVFPIVLLLGAMGYAGIRLDLTNAMISAIAIGIAVDDTLHFLSRYRVRRAELGTESRAVRATLREVGRPMVFTSLVLALGFSVNVFSGFVPHVYFAVLAGLTFLAALLGDLVLLPACLFVFRPEARATRPGIAPSARPI